MGSLVGGWDSDISKLELQKKRSFTNDEIEAYHEMQVKEEDDKKASNSCMPDVVSSGKTEKDVELNVDDSKTPKLEESHPNWWKASNSAFLNIPPEVNVKELRRSNYTPQYEANKK